MNAPRDPNTITPRGPHGAAMPPGNFGAHNFVGNPKLGKFIDFEAHYGRPMEKDEFLAKAEWADRDNPADLHFGGRSAATPMHGKYDDRQPDGTGDGTGRPYEGGITGDDPFDGSGAASVPRGRSTAQPAGVPFGKMTRALPFANQLAAYYGGDFGRPNADDEPEPVKPITETTHEVEAPKPGEAAKMSGRGGGGGGGANGWIDFESSLTAMMQDAERTIASLAAPEAEDGEDAPVARPMAGKSRFDKLASSLAHRKHPPRDPKAVAAAIGREKYGAKGMANLAAHGKMSGDGVPTGTRPRAVEAQASEAVKGIDAAFAGLESLVKSLEPLAKSGSHKYISRKPNGKGYDYVYAHPVTGEHHEIETMHHKHDEGGNATYSRNKGAQRYSSVLAHHEPHTNERIPTNGEREGLAALNRGKKPTIDPAITDPHEREMHSAAIEDTHSLRNASLEGPGVTDETRAALHQQVEKQRAKRAEGRTAGAAPSELSEHLAHQAAHPEEVAREREIAAKPLHERLSHTAEQASERASDPEKHKFGGKVNAHRDAMTAHQKASAAHRRQHDLLAHNGNANDSAAAAEHWRLADRHDARAKMHKTVANKAKNTEKSMDTITDTAGRPLKKGLYAYRLPTDGSTVAVPDQYLYDYLCGFIEQAYEHESSEVEHSKLDAHAQVSAMAQSVMHALVEMIPYNQNLLRACKKFSVTVATVEKLLVEKGYYKPRADSDFTDDGLGAMGADLLAQEDFAYSHQPTPFLSEDMFAVPGLTLRGPVEQPADGLAKGEDERDPHELLAAVHQRAARAQWGSGLTGVPDQTPIESCPIHGGRDLHKAKNLHNPLTPCTCGPRANAYG